MQAAEGLRGVQQGSLRDFDTVPTFDTSTANLLDNFYVPALACSERYDRGVGFFTSSWIKLAASGLSRFAENGGKARIIASPILSSDDALALAEGSEARVSHVLRETLSRSFDELETELEANTLAALAWLVADEILEFKVACPANALDGDFHDKFGIFVDRNNDAIAFNGSPNDSAKAFRNYESISAFYSWESAREAERVAAEQARFERLWSNRDANLRAFEMPDAIRRRLIQFREYGNRPYGGGGAVQSAADRKWRHQKEARECFFEVGNGVLEMATGTGKTRTALSIEDELFERGAIQTVVVTANGTDLLDQWYLELAKRSRRVYRAYDRYHEAQEFLNDPEEAVILTSRLNLKDILPRIPAALKSKALIICDEVHGMGSPAMVRDLPGLIRPFKWRLGLSATPEREYDEDGNDFIETEIGEVVFRFPIEEAIRRGILCEFEYLELEYEFSAEDRDAVRQAIRRYHARAQGPDPIPIEVLYQDIARIRKLSREKLPPFRQLVESRGDLLERCLIFVETTEYGHEVQDILMRAGIRYHTYYGDDDRANLQRFARGELDCLLTCRRISEGIDIHSVSSIVLFSSARAMLETVQRLGRCLRTDPTNPSKRALVVDFIRTDDAEDPDTEAEETADIARRTTMRSWSSIEREE